MSHTPGPWRLEALHGGRLGIRASGKIVSGYAAVVSVDTWMHLEARDEQRCNAQLISCAPELLEACIEARDLLKPVLTEPGRTVFWNLVNAIDLATRQQAQTQPRSSETESAKEKPPESG